VCNRYSEKERERGGGMKGTERKNEKERETGERG